MEFKFISILLLLSQLYIVLSGRLIHSGDRQPRIQPADLILSLHHVRYRPNFVNIPRCFMCINKTTSILYHPIKSFAIGMRILTCGSESYLGLLRDGDTFPFPSYSNHVRGGGGSDPAAAAGVVLGCGTEIGLIQILGLYPRYPMPLVSERGPRFSYRIGSTITEFTLVVGKRAKMLGRPTPLELYDNRYYLTLIGISIGTKLLDIDPKIFESTPLGERGVVIDIGTTYTYLIRPAYYELRTHIAEVLQQGSWNVTLKKLDDRLCYYGTVERDMRNMGMIPQVTLHFGRGVNLSADRFGIFNQEDKDYFCLAFMETTARDMPSQVGLSVQRGYNFGFDATDRKLYIEDVGELK